MTNSNLEVNCPSCRKKFSYYQSEFRPFCCERCKLGDLGKWLNGSYVFYGKDNSVVFQNDNDNENENENEKENEIENEGENEFKDQDYL